MDSTLVSLLLFLLPVLAVTVFRVEFLAFISLGARWKFQLIAFLSFWVFFGPGIIRGNYMASLGNYNWGFEDWGAWAALVGFFAWLFFLRWMIISRNEVINRETLKG